ncbi:MAG: 5'/3'-nucleotidase SurE [Anaerolineae bacterium]
MPHIFLTNDDGVQAPGLLALVQAFKSLGTVQVVAPAINQSAIGHKKTLFTDIPMHETALVDGTPAYAVGGSPADCIAISALGATPWPPDLVVSGINRGPNMAQDITYSGTVTAALESAIHDVPAIAVSLDNHEADNVEDYRIAAEIAVKIAQKVLEKGLPPHTILNLNVPNGSGVKGLRLTRQGIRIYRDALERDGNIYRIVGEIPTGVYDKEGTDLWAVHAGYASLTPLHLDLTAHRFIADLAAWDIEI